MTRRKEITDTILFACQSVLPDIKWNTRLIGKDVNNGVVGTISCDSIDFVNEAKGVVHATANYDICIIDLYSNFDIEGAADQLFAVFNESNMGGICYNAEIKKIIYGGIEKKPDASVCELQLAVEFQYDV